MARPLTLVVGRLWPLLTLALCLVHLTRPALARGKPKFIDLATGSLDNGLDERSGPQQHPHEAPGKPTRLDLDLGQLTETDEKDGSVDSRSGVVSLTTRAPALNVSVPITVATTLEEETSIRYSEPLKCETNPATVKCVEKRLKRFFRTVSTIDNLNVTDSVQIVKKNDNTVTDSASRRNFESKSVLDEIQRFTRDHVIEIKMSNNLVSPRQARTFFGAFGLKKIFLPLILGVQFIKGILIALFLPSIIGTISKIVGKGVTSFAHSSQNLPQQMEESYDFKDNQELYNDDYMTRQPLGTLPASAMYEESMLQPTQAKPPAEIASRFAFVDPRLTPMNSLSDRYYTRHVVNPQSKKQDFKVFHEIPTSSLLLTNYDPFYSPLLSRLDAVFSSLGHTSEACREYAVCAMYRNPARYAPYSNLVSAQLSRELNELRKPSSDNPDVLRFFRYMKAAKDGQDGLRCEEAYPDCDSARDDQTLRQNQAMLATYQDIDKLVHARKL
ncbi:hypothetical protein QAD02_020127 [Eretmocerus hayati]|uniref:Uncharacterized protein n=1 Tax=Eretmocerus hayati TaxID=131215 RepID=A0ACC2PLN9_9HYME|nr:hypothetical protein QAD02_020127 [Eretmocerus hayati]